MHAMTYTLAAVMASRERLLQAALNGDREHPAVPRTPEELAAEARAAVDAGATPVLVPYTCTPTTTTAAKHLRRSRAPRRCARSAPCAPGYLSRSAPQRPSSPTRSGDLRS
jgi:2-keto-3-deoxy-L-rhamnonate aldolase RhmA